MTELTDWLDAAERDARETWRGPGEWMNVPELERAGHDPHDADHIARWSPDIALAVTALVRMADQWRTICMTLPHEEWTEGEYATECMLIDEIDAVRQVIGARE